MSNSPMLFRQLFEKESSTYTYLLADKSDSTSILIDPVLETVERDAKLIQELGLTLKYVINTHMHADHITGTGELKKKFPNAKSIIGKKSGADVADIFLESGDKIEFGSRYLTAFNTPGHTEGCLTYVMDDHSCIFTGDTLLIRGCGRTDFQGGSSDMLYNSVRNILFGEKLNLSDDCIVYPAHDYNGRMCSSIGEEKKYNPRLKDGISVEEFSDIMANLNLAYPKKIDVSLPRNRLCGAFEIDNGGTK